MTHLLKAEQMASLSARLRGRAALLLDELREDLVKTDTDRAEMLADRVRDVGDESLATLIVDLDLADTDRDLGELKDVEAALSRLRLGTYGTCLDCGGPIPFARLEAFPTAKRCQPCQRHYEASHAQQNRQSL